MNDRASNNGTTPNAAVGMAGSKPKARIPGMRAKGRWVLAALAAVIVACALAAGLALAQDSAKQQGAASVRQAVLSAAMQCAAVEGSYPSTIEHLEDYYGLSVNHDDYVINYEAFASNVMPSVTVVPR